MTIAPPSDKKLMIFLVTEDWYFYSHRLPMVRAAQQAGLAVAVITNISTCQKAIEDQGVRVIPLSLERRSLNPFKALGHIRQIARIYRREQPLLVHHIGMKPVLYGALAAWRAKVPHVVNAFAGLGYVFYAKDTKARLLRPILTALFRVLLRRRGSWLLFQNKDDMALLQKYGLVDDSRAVLIRGSGVDLTRYKSAPLPEVAPEFICMFAGRMIGIKGLPTLKEAFDILARTAPHIRLWLCGRPDPDNPGSWSEEQLTDWAANSPNVIYKGHCDNIAALWQQAHLALQPSYGGEGVPKSLLEAAACGRAIIASDTPGCREMVEEGRNGYLVPPYDAQKLAARIAALAASPDLCRQMGLHSRQMVEGDMSAEAVTAQTAALYQRCLSANNATAGTARPMRAK